MGASSCKGVADAQVGANNPVIIVGCSDYCDQIRTIWDGMKQHFIKAGVEFDFVLFTNYDRQVEALLGGHIDIAWNGPLAHVRTQKRTGGASLSLGMRDVDCSFVTRFIVRNQACIIDLAGLKNKRLAVGTRDSPQACILPLQFLKSEGVALDTMDVTFFDHDYGKHGDTAVGEIEVMKALSRGDFDVGIVSDMMWQRALSSADVNAGSGEELEVLAARERQGAGLRPLPV
ncbi:unnamed protein product [Polarella glacialis]|uniref:Thiamine pyrimidine synthase n=1 Tax=Polarella glacialis TaxID=89957 RepID=A0A813HVK0_POLGL|nr:unnamed protein product [Polarella glacialis]